MFGFESQDISLTAEQAAHIGTPITEKVINVKKVGDSSANGASPVPLFQPLWIASLAIAESSL